MKSLLKLVPTPRARLPKRWEGGSHHGKGVTCYRDLLPIMAIAKQRDTRPGGMRALACRMLPGCALLARLKAAILGCRWEGRLSDEIWINGGLSLMADSNWQPVLASGRTVNTIIRGNHDRVYGGRCRWFPYFLADVVVYTIVKMLETLR